MADTTVEDALGACGQRARGPLQRAHATGPGRSSGGRKGSYRTARCAALTVWLWAGLASAQSTSSQPRQGTQAPPQGPEAQQSSAEHAATARTEVQQRARILAKLLNPSAYGPAFHVGAEAEYLTPAAGASSILLGYDAVWLSMDLSFGMLVGAPLPESQSDNDLYTTSLRVGVPVHRGIRADFSLVVGGGVTLTVPPGKGHTTALGTAVGGGQFRVFMTPNVAVAATLGLLALFRSGHSSLLAGARPLGAAAVVYFFR